MADTDEKNKSEHSVLDFLVRKIKHEKKPPICKGDHDWVLIDGKGYDYKSGYYFCKKCESRMSRQDFER